MKKLKIGIIGYGKMGKIRHIAIEKSKRAEVVAVFDPNPIESLNNKVKLMNTAEDVLNQSIQAVFICTPNNFIKPLTISALKKRIYS